MHFTDGQLLTAADINNFLLNRETNPQLDEAKAATLSRIRELEKTIPAAGQDLTTLPTCFITDAVPQAWKFSFKRTDQDFSTWETKRIDISSDVNIDNLALIEYDQDNRTFNSFSSDATRLKPSSPWAARGYTLMYDTTYISKGRAVTEYFVTLNKKMNLKINTNSSAYSDVVIEEIVDGINALMNNQL